MTDASADLAGVSLSLEGRNALVTGASSGLGRHFALTLAKAGARVALAARRGHRLAEVAAEIADFDGRGIPVQMDVTDTDSVRAGVAAAATELGPITILLNNSGVAVTKSVLDQDETDWDAVVGTNLKGAWLVAQEVARHMVGHGHGGSIINIASVLALRVAKHLAPYAASKAGLLHLTEALALELAAQDIRVNAIAPGYFATEMNQDFFATEAGQRMIKRIPQRRIGELDDLNGALLLLASDASRYMTGALITVDGGHAVCSI
ncbi:MAG: glucose 1-dehydrogenase [Alphaproteobacteria bacterium]|nr:glucose 1-dehydrogenase [Alphaproteobacteria bacterium]